MLHKVCFQICCPRKCFDKTHLELHSQFQRKVGRYTSPYCNLINTDTPPIMNIQILIRPLASFPQRKIEYAGIALLPHRVIFLMTKFYRGWSNFNVYNQIG